VRLSHEQKVLMQRAAALDGTTLSNFVIRSVQKAAERTIREHQVITLSARDSLVLAEALLNPPAPSTRLRVAATRYQQMVEEAWAVVAPLFRVELLNAAHNRAAFSCGVPALDRYLVQQAGQEMRRGVARVFVLCEQGFIDVLGYYTLSPTSIDYGDLPAEISKRLPRYPTLPALLLGRLAVEARRQGQGLGLANRRTQRAGPLAR
jgi:uncharacterized protein (DUF1778 family)